MASYAYTFSSGDTVTPNRLNDARTVSNIVNADISATAAIAHTKLASISSGQVLLGNASSVPTATALSGDVTVSNTGVTAITAGVVVDADINASAAIALSKLATGALPTAITVASANIVDGTIVNADISASAAIAGTKVSPNFGTQNITTTGQILAKTGTSASPGYSFTGDTNTGLTRPTTDSIALVEGGVERIRLTSAGDTLFNTTVATNAADASTAVGTTIYGGASIHISNNASPALFLRRTVDNGDIIRFYRTSTSDVGAISVTTTATSYVTSSDYRLKQNIEPMSGGLAKLGQLKPSTFEFIAEPGVKVDGFIAHEVQAIVPQAVTGVKDGEEMQGIDQSKLVPILVAALQELSAKVAALEARLA
ncbi:MAG: tail fiber domain-containing protein [Candidatus Limnocylindrus sp.]